MKKDATRPFWLKRSERELRGRIWLGKKLRLNLISRRDFKSRSKLLKPKLKDSRLLKKRLLLWKEWKNAKDSNVNRGKRLDEIRNFKLKWK